MTCTIAFSPKIPVDDRAARYHLFLFPAVCRPTLMSNICAQCGDNLIDHIEYRYGLCVYCLAVAIDRYEEDALDSWYDEGGA